MDPAYNSDARECSHRPYQPNISQKKKNLTEVVNYDFEDKTDPGFRSDYSSLRSYLILLSCGFITCQLQMIVLHWAIGFGT